MPSQANAPHSGSEEPLAQEETEQKFLLPLLQEQITAAAPLPAPNTAQPPPACKEPGPLPAPRGPRASWCPAVFSVPFSMCLSGTVVVSVACHTVWRTTCVRALALLRSLLLYRSGRIRLPEAAADPAGPALRSPSRTLLLVIGSERGISREGRFLFKASSEAMRGRERPEYPRPSSDAWSGAWQRRGIRSEVAGGPPALCLTGGPHGDPDSSGSQ